MGYGLVRATRISYVGELGWELYIPTEFTLGVFDRLMEVGEAEGLQPAGLHALNSLRIEKAYRHWGHDIGPEDNPFQAGLGFAVALDKPGGFIGREALLRAVDDQRFGARKGRAHVHACFCRWNRVCQGGRKLCRFAVSVHARPEGGIRSIDLD